METCDAFGVDLGTSNTVTAVVCDGRIEVVPDTNGYTVIPSYLWVADSENQYVYGFVAKSRLRTQPRSVFHDVKRLIGLHYNDPLVQRIKDSVLFQIVDDGHNKPLLCCVNREGEKVRKYPEEVISIMLEHVKMVTQSFMATPITDVVITVPVLYSQYQCSIVRSIADSVGLKTIGILTEPTAAAFAYADYMSIKEETIMVYDLGGGTFGVSIIHIKGAEFTELARGGNSSLGGNDIITLIMNEVLEYYEKEAGEAYRKLTAREMGLLRLSCDGAKNDMSIMLATEIEVSGCEEWTYTLTRERFSDIIYGLVKETIHTCNEAMERAHVTVKDLSRIVLVGGSTRLQQITTELGAFYKIPISRQASIDECVAYGAAKYACYLARHPEAKERERRVMTSGFSETDTLPLVHVNFHSVEIIDVSTACEKSAPSCEEVNVGSSSPPASQDASVPSNQDSGALSSCEALPSDSETSPLVQSVQAVSPESESIQATPSESEPTQATPSESEPSQTPLESNPISTQQTQKPLPKRVAPPPVKWRKTQVVKKEAELITRYGEIERKAHEMMQKMSDPQRIRELEDALFECSKKTLTKELLDELESLINQQECSAVC